MTSIKTPQNPDDSRKVVRGVDDDGNLVFQQVGLQEIDFFARFGAKVTSSSENTIGVGTQIYTADIDADKIRVGDDVQITSLVDVQCYQYGIVVANDTTTYPSQLTIVVNDVSPLTGTFSSWEIQVVARPKAWLEVDISTTSIDPTAAGPFTMTVTAGKMFPLNGSVLLRSIEDPRIAVLALVNNYSGTSLVLRKIATTASVSQSYSAWDVALIDAPPQDLPFLSIVGLTVSADASGTPWPVTITPGSVMDSTNTVRLTLESTLVKRLSATWAVGTNQGGVVLAAQTGTITSVGTAVTGTGTSFTSNFSTTPSLDDYVASGGLATVKSRITTGSQYRYVESVTNDTALVLGASFSPDVTGAAFSRNAIKESTVRFGNWFVLLIRKDSDGSIDSCFSAPTADGIPDIPAGYTYYRVLATITDNTQLAVEQHIYDANAPYISGTELIVTYGVPDAKSVNARYITGTSTVQFTAGASDIQFTVPANGITNTELNNMAAYTLKGRNAGTTGDPSDIDISALTEKVTLADDDLFLIQDSAASNAFKKAKKSNVGGGGGTSFPADMGLITEAATTTFDCGTIV